MINTSSEFQNEIANGNSKFINKASILLTDGTRFEIDSSQIMDGGMKYDDAVTSSNKFEIGACIINKCTLKLNNIYDDFSQYDFYDATITAYTGLKLENGTTEWLQKGIYEVDEPTVNGSYVTLEALDYMSKLDVEYSSIGTAYPATLLKIVLDICSFCGVSLSTNTFSNYSYVVNKRPVDEKLTARQVLSYVCGVSGNYARFNTKGKLELKWYDNSFESRHIGLDGGLFDNRSETIYLTGDSADGGDFYTYGGQTYDSGTFDDFKDYFNIYSLNSHTISTDDIVISGITVSKEIETTGSEKTTETYTYGKSGYVLSIANNPLVNDGDCKKCATFLGGKLVGMKFRPFDVSAVGNPSIEAGDVVIVNDEKGKSYFSYATSISYTIGSYQNISCDAETPSKKASVQFSVAEQQIIEERKHTLQTVNQFSEMALNAMGYYETVEKQDDGSVITYSHDKPLLSDSQIIYKKTIDGFFLSQDGGKTYTTGFDSEGNARYNILDAIGINADWIKAGELSFDRCRGGTLYLGGTDNKNGNLQILNSKSEVIVEMTNEGLVVNDGSLVVNYEYNGMRLPMFAANGNGVGIGEGAETITYYAGDPFVSISGELRLLYGILTGYNNGNKGIEINNTSIKMYSWSDKGNYVGMIGSALYSSGRNGVTFTCDEGDMLSIGYKDGEVNGQSHFQSVFTVDANDGVVPPRIAGGVDGPIKIPVLRGISQDEYKNINGFTFKYLYVEISHGVITGWHTEEG